VGSGIQKGGAVMEKLTSLDQLKVGTKLRIIGRNEKDSYGSVSVKKIIKCESSYCEPWTEILINSSRNFFFHFENYLKGESQWVKELYVLEGFDKRLKGTK
jgi:hypothetical protein